MGLLVGSGGLGDHSYNDMTFSGLGKAQKEFGFKLIIEETNRSATSQSRALLKLFENGAEVIIANGSGLHNLISESAPRYPDKYFIINDFAISGFNNIASTVFAHEEGSYLVGLLAASLSKTGNIGFIGGVDQPVLHTFLKGYKLGAQSVVPGIKTRVAFISPQGDYSGFANPSRGFEIASQMYLKDVDIIYAVAGLTGNGVIQAAYKHGKMAVGVDSDQDHMAKGHVLTSMIKKLDRSTYLEVSKVMKGEFESGVKYYGLKNGGISLSPMRFTKHLIPEETLKKLKQAEQDIIDGRITFP